MKKLTERDVVFEIDVSQDDTPVRGNAQASGDADADREAEDAIIERLSAGDVWAWCIIRVKARLKINEELYGEDILSGNSYKDEAAFRADAYFEDMKLVALANLQSEYERIIDR